MMLKPLIIALSLIGLTTPSWAEKPLRVLYMEIDAGQKLLSKNHPAFHYIFEETGDYLQNEAGMRLMTQRPDQERRSMKKALKDVEVINPKKLDAVVLVSLRRMMKRTPDDQIKNRLIAKAHIIDPYSLKQIDQVTIKSPIAKIRAQYCGDECRRALGQRHVQNILPEFQKQVTRSLYELDRPTKKVAGKPPQNYTLTLKGFSKHELHFLEDRIARLDGTRDFSSLRSHPDKPAYWLERRKKAPLLRDDLSDVLSTLDLKARIIETQRMITLIKVKRNLAMAY